MATPPVQQTTSNNHRLSFISHSLPSICGRVANVTGALYDCLPETVRSPLLTGLTYTIWASVVVLPLVGIATAIHTTTLAISILALLSLQFVLICTQDRGSSEELSQRLALWSSNSNLQGVIFALNAGAALDPTSPSNADCLTLAVECGSIAAVQTLLDRGANPNLIPRNNIPALVEAAFFNRLEILRLLLQHGADLQLSAPTVNVGPTALREAAASGHTEMVRELLDRGVDVNQRPIIGSTALVEAAFAGHVPVLRLLLERGARVNDVGSLGITALQMAASRGHLEAFQLLLEHRADPTLADNLTGRTVLTCAAEGGCTEAVQRLLDQGADVSGASSLPSLIAPRTPLSLAAEEGHTSTLRTLLEHGAVTDLDQPDYRGITPLMHAALGGHLEACQLLLEYGAAVNLQDSRGERALTCVLLHNNNPENRLAILRLLLQHSDIETNFVNAQGQTPLIRAVCAPRAQAEVALLAQYSNPMLTDSEGFTALDHALRNNHPSLVQTLAQHGARFTPNSTFVAVQTEHGSEYDIRNYMRDNGWEVTEEQMTALGQAYQEGISSVSTVVEIPDPLAALTVLGR